MPFRELIERHQRAVINTIHRAIGDAWEAEDLAQRVFIQVHRSAKTLQADRQIHDLAVHDHAQHDPQRTSPPQSSSFRIVGCAAGTARARERRLANLADTSTPDPRAGSGSNANCRIKSQKAVRDLPEMQRNGGSPVSL